MNNVSHKQRKRRNKNKTPTTESSTTESSTNAKIPVSVNPPVEIEDSTTEVIDLEKFQEKIIEDFQWTLARNMTNALIDKFVELCLTENMIIFGGYVRDYLAKRIFNHNVSDIDVFSYDISGAIFIKLLEKNGFYVNEGHSDESYEILNEKPFDVTKFSVGLMNDELFLGRKIAIRVDFVMSKTWGQPPFKSLDFESNAWIWDRHGIRLSQDTGTELDTLSHRDIKDREAQIITDIRNRTTTYHPIHNDKSMDEINIRRRKIRVERLLKMMCRGWIIKNNPVPIELFSYHKGDQCSICQDIFHSYCLKSSCCEMKYHYSCYIDYAKSELDERIYIRCPQRCSDYCV